MVDLLTFFFLVWLLGKRLGKGHKYPQVKRNRRMDERLGSSFGIKITSGSSQTFRCLPSLLIVDMQHNISVKLLFPFCPVSSSNFLAATVKLRKLSTDFPLWHYLPMIEW